MGFPHCPICVALAFFSFCVVLTRSYMIFVLFKEFVEIRYEKDYSSLKSKYLLG